MSDYHRLQAVGSPYWRLGGVEAIPSTCIVEVERRLRYICVDDVLIGNLALGGLGNEPRQVNLMHVKVYTSRTSSCTTTCCILLCIHEQTDELTQITIKNML